MIDEGWHACVFSDLVRVRDDGELLLVQNFTKNKQHKRFLVHDDVHQVDAGFAQLTPAYGVIGVISAGEGNPCFS